VKIHFVWQAAFMFNHVPLDTGPFGEDEVHRIQQQQGGYSLHFAPNPNVSRPQTPNNFHPNHQHFASMTDTVLTPDHSKSDFHPRRFSHSETDTSHNNSSLHLSSSPNPPNYLNNAGSGSFTGPQSGVLSPNNFELDFKDTEEEIKKIPNKAKIEHIEKTKQSIKEKKRHKTKMAGPKKSTNSSKRKNKKSGKKDENAKMRKKRTKEGGNKNEQHEMGT